MESGGGTVPTRALGDEEYLVFLLRKVMEEAEELAHATTDDNLVEEIADVYEIVDALLKLKGIDRVQVLAVQMQKREKRGGFDKRTLMLGNL